MAGRHASSSDDHGHPHKSRHPLLAVSALESHEGGLAKFLAIHKQTTGFNSTFSTILTPLLPPPTHLSHSLPNCGLLYVFSAWISVVVEDANVWRLKTLTAPPRASFWGGAGQPRSRVVATYSKLGAPASSAPARMQVQQDQRGAVATARLLLLANSVESVPPVRRAALREAEKKLLLMPNERCESDVRRFVTYSRPARCNTSHL